MSWNRLKTLGKRFAPAIALTASLFSSRAEAARPQIDKITLETRDNATGILHKNPRSYEGPLDTQDVEEIMELTVDDIIALTPEPAKKKRVGPPPAPKGKSKQRKAIKSPPVTPPVLEAPSIDSAPVVANNTQSPTNKLAELDRGWEEILEGLETTPATQPDIKGQFPAYLASKMMVSAAGIDDLNGTLTEAGRATSARLKEYYRSLCYGAIPISLAALTGAGLLMYRRRREDENLVEAAEDDPINIQLLDTVERVEGMGAAETLIEGHQVTTSLMAEEREVEDLATLGVEEIGAKEDNTESTEDKSKFERTFDNDENNEGITSPASVIAGKPVNVRIQAIYRGKYNISEMPSLLSKLGAKLEGINVMYSELRKMTEARGVNIKINGNLPRDKEAIEKYIQNTYKDPIEVYFQDDLEGERGRRITMLGYGVNFDNDLERLTQAANNRLVKLEGFIERLDLEILKATRFQRTDTALKKCFSIIEGDRSNHQYSKIKTEYEALLSKLEGNRKEIDLDSITSALDEAKGLYTECKRTFKPRISEDCTSSDLSKIKSPLSVAEKRIAVAQGVEKISSLYSQMIALMGEISTAQYILKERAGMIHYRNINSDIAQYLEDDDEADDLSSSLLDFGGKRYRGGLSILGLKNEGERTNVRFQHDYNCQTLYAESIDMIRDEFANLTDPDRLLRVIRVLEVSIMERVERKNSDLSRVQDATVFLQKEIDRLEDLKRRKAIKRLFDLQGEAFKQDHIKREIGALFDGVERGLSDEEAKKASAIRTDTNLHLDIIRGYNSDLIELEEECAQLGHNPTNKRQTWHYRLNARSSRILEKVNSNPKPQSITEETELNLLAKELMAVYERVMRGVNKSINILKVKSNVIQIDSRSDNTTPPSIKTA